MSLRTRIKFCGLTSVADAQAAVALGVDAIGLVVTRKSARFAGIDVARDIRRSLPPFVCAVALFMDDGPAWISQAVAQVCPDLLQFHGSESAADCDRHARPYLKAIAMGGGLSVNARAAEIVAAYPRATGFLLDGHAAGQPGGTGEVFDWSQVPSSIGRTIVLAGGLTCDNVGAAIRTARPYAVDVSSGIESSPGVKDAQKMRRFVEEVRRACGE
jgi:phosphoribosylanthranilate isomerase